MTLLQIMADSDAADVRLRTADPEVIGAELNRRGIVFARWEAPAVLTASTSTDHLLAEYAERIGELNADGRYRHIDVARIHPDDDDPEWPAKAKGAREKFLAEHRHAEDEVRFFAGEGGRGRARLNGGGGEGGG